MECEQGSLLAGNAPGGMNGLVRLRKRVRPPDLTNARKGEGRLQHSDMHSCSSCSPNPVTSSTDPVRLLLPRPTRLASTIPGINSLKPPRTSPHMQERHFGCNSVCGHLGPPAPSATSNLECNLLIHPLQSSGASSSIFCHFVLFLSL
ncbi:hypothetical protein KC19_3G182400 [Ceratodon purpureus]|uniref:Uncharacterized protein n=1 Tax=Ceratodon purpureus TaxID=3225 RepID=A0A8T0INC2_CERPU|nr:hypothetical protein KC19_3G182400 [Ceratodon purpureus]